MSGKDTRVSGRHQRARGASVFRWARLQVRRGAILAYAADLLHPVKFHEVRRELSLAHEAIQELAFDQGWNTRTSAAVAVAFYITRTAARLDHDRRERIVAKLLHDKPGDDAADLERLADLVSGISNTVGVDPFLVSLHNVLGTLSEWKIHNRLNFDVKSILLYLFYTGLYSGDPSLVEDWIVDLLSDSGKLGAET